MDVSQEDDLSVFKPMLEEMRQQLCESGSKSEVELEQITSLILTIGVQQFDEDDVNSMLNVVLKFVKENTDKFPSISLLGYVKQCLEHLAKASRRKKEGAHFVALSWPSDLRLIICRLFQAFKLPEEYLVSCYELCSLASRALGIVWLQSDPQFAVLVTSLTSGRLRIVLENASEIKMDQLVLCLSLLEDLIQCVEDDESDLLSEKDATSISKFEQEASSFVCECIVKLAEESNVNSLMECFLVLYRFLCAFLAVGGGKIMDQKSLSAALPTLISVTRFCIGQRDVETAGLLLINLADFNELPDTVLDVLMDYIRLILPTAKAKRGITQVSAVLEELKDRKGWYNARSLEDAEELSKNIGDKRMIELIHHVRAK